MKALDAHPLAGLLVAGITYASIYLAALAGIDRWRSAGTDARGLLRAQRAEAG
jgi:hypothetical protein